MNRYDDIVTMRAERCITSALGCPWMSCNIEAVFTEAGPKGTQSLTAIFLPAEACQPCSNFGLWRSAHSRSDYMHVRQQHDRTAGLVWQASQRVHQLWWGSGGTTCCLLGQALESFRFQVGLKLTPASPTPSCSPSTATNYSISTTKLLTHY